MHEFSLCQSLVSSLYKQPLIKEERKLNRIEVTVGPLAGVEPKLLEHAFPLAIRNTPFSDVTLVLKQKDIVVQCDDCQASSTAKINQLSCLRCGSKSTHVIQGNECHLTRLFYGEVEHV